MPISNPQLWIFAKNCDETEYCPLIPNKWSIPIRSTQESLPLSVSTSCVMTTQPLAAFGRSQMKGIRYVHEVLRVNQSSRSPGEDSRWRLWDQMGDKLRHRIGGRPSRDHKESAPLGTREDPPRSDHSKLCQGRAEKILRGPLDYSSAAGLGIHLDTGIARPGPAEVCL